MEEDGRWSRFLLKLVGIVGCVSASALSDVGNINLSSSSSLSLSLSPVGRLIEIFRTAGEWEPL